MNKINYTMASTLGELLEQPAAVVFFNQIAPGMMESPAMGFMSSAPLNQLAAMNIHRNPLNGRHPEYFSEDPYLAGIMAGYQSKGLEENGVSSCIKHTVANNCESARKRNHSLITERALREIYLKVFEVAIGVHNPDAMMTGYNAVNGVFAAEDVEMIQGVFRNEFGFKGFVMTDWNSYDTIDIVSAVSAGNCWITPGSMDNTYVTPIVNGVRAGHISLERLQSNVRYLVNIVMKRG